jgi:hypothetical protein
MTGSELYEVRRQFRKYTTLCTECHQGRLKEWTWGFCTAIKKKYTHIQDQLMFNHTSPTDYTIQFRQLIPAPHLHCISHPLVGSVALQTTFEKSSSNWIGPCCTPQTPPTPTPPLYKAASHSAAHLCSNLWPLKMGPTAAPETSWGTSSCTLCKIPKTKNQYSFHGESLKSTRTCSS